MCGIVGLHLRDPGLQPQLGRLLETMLGQVAERGPDSAGVAIYGDERRCPPGHAAVSVLDAPADLDVALRRVLPGAPEVVLTRAGATTVVAAPVGPQDLVSAVRTAAPQSLVVGAGSDVTVYKGIGHPRDLARTYDLAHAAGWQGLGHTRMATESAITPAGCHPFSVGEDQCLVHNGSFANHATIRRRLMAEGVVFDSENDSEVGARFVAQRLAAGLDLEKALLELRDAFDGFYTLLVTTADGFAVVRDPIACKPAIIAETDAWVAMASEFRALAELPGIERARVFEPEPGRVYTWQALTPAELTATEATPGLSLEPSPGPESLVIDLAQVPVRGLNTAVHAAEAERYEVLNPQGAHAIAAGVRHPITIDVRGHAGYYCAGMNDGATVTVDGSVGVGVAENMMSGRVHVRGDASQSAGATGHGGLLVIEGDASMRCGISMKGIDIVVGGDIGAMSAFMAQAGRLVVCGDAGDGLGDSIYEARIYVRGTVASLGADCVVKPMGEQHRQELAELLAAAGLDADPDDFRRYGSARRLYHFTAGNSAAY